MYPHRIRLRGPWQCEPLQRTSGDQPLPGPFSMKIPTRWRDGGLANFAGRVRFRRHFGYPGRIDDYERVWLTFAAISGSGQIQLNGKVLGQFDDAERLEFEVTNLLQPRNELVVEVQAADDDGGICGEVALEVRCVAYLRNVRFEALREPHSLRLRVNGEVVGEWDRPLELYALAVRSTVAYATVEARPLGQPFELVSEPIPMERQVDLPVRVELVNGATVWFLVEGWVPDLGGGR